MLHALPALPALPALGEHLLVLALCAQWCGTCREFRPVLERIARARPQLRFAWADVEDDAEWVGELEIDDFPVLLVARAGKVLHYGASLPLEAVVARLVDALERSDVASAAAPAAARQLAQRLCAPHRPSAS